MSSTTTNNISPPNANATSESVPRPPMMRSMSTPSTPTSPMASSPWYRQKFEFYRDAIEEKVHDEYPDLPQTHKLEPINIEPSTEKGYDLDFPVELHDGRSAIVSLSYGQGRPPYTKEERRKLISVRQNTTDGNQ